MRFSRFRTALVCAGLIMLVGLPQSAWCGLDFEEEPKVDSLQYLLEQLLPISIDVREHADTASPSENELPPALLPEVPEDADYVSFSSVVVTGASEANIKLVQEKLTLRVGENYHRLRIEREIKNMHALGVFEDVTWEYRPESGELCISLVENPIVESILFTGNTVFTAQELEALLAHRAGQALNVNGLREDIKVIEQHYQDKGYILTKVLNVKRPDPQDPTLEFTLAEGMIEKIIILGNDRTKPHVILREMYLHEGEVFRRDLFEKDIRRIFNLGYFDSINPNVTPGRDPSHVVITIEVDEKSGGSVSLGGGYSQLDGLFLFTDLNLENLFGEGYNAMLKGQFGKSNTYQFKYSSNWFLEAYRPVTLRVWNTSGVTSYLGSSSQINYRNETRVGMDGSLTQPLSEQFSLSTTLKGEEVSVPSPNPGDRSFYKIRSVRETLAFDTRDYILSPRMGVLYSMSVEQGIPIDSQSIAFTRLDVNLNHFYPIGDKATLAFRLIGGLKLGVVESSELYYVGGSTTVRGFEDASPFATGTRQGIFNIEYRYPFNEMFTLVAFYDAGFATQSLSSFDLSQVRTGKGLGVRMVTPLGPIRLDYGIADDGHTVPHFSIGHTF